MTERLAPEPEGTRIEMEILPRFKIITDLPPTKETFTATELNCLPLGGRPRHRLRAVGITTIAEVFKLSDQEIDSIRQTGPVTVRKIRTVCGEFCQRIIAEAAKNPGQPIIIKLQDEIRTAVAAGKTPLQIEQIYGLWPEITRRIVDPQKAGKRESVNKKTERNQRIIELIGGGFSYQKAAETVAQEFGELPISRERVRQIVKKGRESQGS